MKADAVAFCPGHITGFFEIRDEASNPAQIGSRGAGFSVALGVESRVRVLDDGVPGVGVRIAGKIDEATTTRRAVELLVGAEPLRVDVDQRVDLPVSQGFGMSSAGALSAALALAEILGRPRKEAVWAAHCAEVFQRTGLGDVVGAAKGGFELRVRPGCEPHGEVRNWVPEGPVGEVLLAVVSPAVSTKRVLTDPVRRAEINRRGAGLVDAFLEGPTLSGFIDASRRFAQDSRLATPEILRLWDDMGDRMAIGQAQLGGSVFVFGASPSQRRSLGEAGTVLATRVDREGARVTQSRRDLADG